MDILRIDQLTVMARVGIYNWEKKCLQKLVFDIQLMYSDNIFINKTNKLLYLDYSKISDIIMHLVNMRHFPLIEEIAEVVSQILIEKFLMIYQIRIKISKPGAIYNARNVSIYIKRKRSKLNNLKKIDLYTGWK